MTRHVVWQAVLALLGIVLIFIILFQLVSSVPPEETVEAPVAGGTYVEGILGYWEEINPILAPRMVSANPVEQDLSSLVFDGLTVLGEDGRILPLLATDWEVAEDGMAYEFHLRQGVTWHDGVPFTASDVAFTIQAIQDPDYQGDSNLADLWRNVMVEVVDRHTVRFRLAEPFPSFLYYTTIGLLPAHLLGNVPAAELSSHPFSRQQPIGTGMFQVQSAQPDRIVLAAYDDYWRATPYLKQVEFWLYDDWDGLLTDYERGEIYGFHPPEGEILSLRAEMPGVQIHSAQAAGYGIVFLNLARESVSFFQEKEVRQALLYALDRQALVDRVLGGLGLVADSPIMPFTWAYDPTLRQYGHDPERAIGLLDAAGWMDSDADRIRDREGADLAFTLLVSDDPTLVQLGQEMARQWLALGIEVEIRSVSSEAAGTFVRTRNFDAVLVKMALTADPDPYPLWHSTQAESGQNFSGFANEEADLAMEEVRSTTDVERQVQLYHSFQQIFAEEVPSLLIYYPIYTYAMDDRVRDVQLSPLLHPSQRFRNIQDWYIQPEEVTVNEPNMLDKSGE